MTTTDNANTSPASVIEKIREAARLMRERAEKATPEPWAAHADGLVWAQRIGDPVSGSTEVEDARHIASWHPAVADWLDFEAGMAAKRGNSAEGNTFYALRVARAYLGESVTS